MRNTTFSGHLLAFIVSAVWGCTFVSSAVLLRSFSPIEIIFFRFLLAYAALWLIRPKRMRLGPFRQELLYAVAGLTGITLYFICENNALIYTSSANVGVIIATAPMLTALLSGGANRKERQGPMFYMGFLVSIVGIALINFNGAVILDLNPLGDLLTLLAAFSWALYSLAVAAAGKSTGDGVQVSRRIFFWALVFTVPFLAATGFRGGADRLIEPKNLMNLGFLGLIASAACFIMWNRAIELIGAVKSNTYLYVTPVVSIVASAVVLKERITWMALLGAALTLVGLWVSERKPAADRTESGGEK